MNTHIEFIEHKDHRYPTVGDYLYSKDEKGNDLCTIRVSKMGNEDYETLVALHEFIESYLCRLRGVQEEDITKFDIMYEEEREKGIHGEDEEPGNDPRAPYRDMHKFATFIERMMAEELGVDWDEYDKTVVNL